MWYRLPRIKWSVLNFAAAGAMLSKKSLGRRAGSGSFFLGFFLLAMYILLSVEIVKYLRGQILLIVDRQQALHILFLRQLHAKPVVADGFLQLTQVASSTPALRSTGSTNTNSREEAEAN